MLDFFGDQQPAEQAVGLAKYLGEVGNEPGLAAEVEGMVEEDFHGALEKLIDASHTLLELPETDVEGPFNTIVYLLRNARREATGDLIKKLCDVMICGKERIIACLKALLTLYNNFQPSDPHRFEVYVAIVKVAGVSGRISALMPQLSHLEDLMATWSLQLQQKQQLYHTVYEAAMASSHSTLAREYLVKYLQAFNGCDAETLSSVKGEAERCIVDSLRIGDLYQLDSLLDLDAVKQLEGTKVYELLVVFIEGNVKSWRAFQAENEDLLQQLGLDAEPCLKKMRLLTLATLASKARQVRYDDIALHLEIDDADVEMWVIEAVRAKLIEGRMDQIGKRLIVRMAVGRTFRIEDWATVSDRLAAWAASVVEIKSRLHSVKAQPTLSFPDQRFSVTLQ